MGCAVFPLIVRPPPERHTLPPPPNGRGARGACRLACWHFQRVYQKTCCRPSGSRRFPAAFVSVRGSCRAKECPEVALADSEALGGRPPAYVSIRQHLADSEGFGGRPPAYIRIRLHTFSNVCIREHTSAHTSVSPVRRGFARCASIICTFTAKSVVK